MFDKSRRVAALVAFLPAMALVQGCVLFAAGAGGGAAYTAAQERSMGNAVDDTTITTKINAQLVQAGLFRHVSVDAVEGRVLLTGVVNSPTEKEQAMQIARGVTGVKEVLNDLQVGGGGFTRSASDAWMTSKLRAQLIADREVSSINYNLNTVNGVIYIFGIAQNQQELERVLNHARSVSGAKDVVSHVEVKDTTRGTA